MDNNLTNLGTEDVVEQLLLHMIVMFLDIFPGLRLAVAKILTLWNYMGCSRIEADSNLDRTSKEENKRAFTLTLCLRFRSIFETLHGCTFYRFSRNQATFKGLYDKMTRSESEVARGVMAVVSVVMLSMSDYQGGRFLDCIKVYHACNIIANLFDKLNIPLKQIVFLTRTQINDLVALAEHVPIMEEEPAEALHAFGDNDEVEETNGDSNDNGSGPALVRIRLRDALGML